MCGTATSPAVVPEPCADRALGPHESNLFDPDAKYADAVSLFSAEGRLRA
ncbi:hypothetical protein GCM10022255_013030 [Dactylosporangium darangshiense]|uniref:Uncharacterized protein n=1 Tax=Dactylosporangium darangshiense TaxID=579108 RepID=A0ABP8CZZ0_9ACTN